MRSPKIIFCAESTVINSALNVEIPESVRQVIANIRDTYTTHIHVKKLWIKMNGSAKLKHNYQKISGIGVQRHQSSFICFKLQVRYFLEM